MPRKAGRPSIHGPEAEKRIKLLRRQNWKWNDIAVDVKIPASTCRKIFARKIFTR